MEHSSVSKLLLLCEELQDQTYLRDVIYDYQMLRTSCDLLLRNMILILQLQNDGKSFEDELDYLTENLVTVYSNLTSKKREDILNSYQIDEAPLT